MTVLQPAFFLLTICGCWRPSMWTMRYKRVLYTLYTILVISFLHTFCISQFLNVILNVETADELSDSVYMFIANVLSCFKIITLLMNHNNIEMLCKKLNRKPCKPRNHEEAKIQRSFDNRIGSVTIYYTALVETTVLCMILSSIFTDFRHKKLAYNAWLPFNYSSRRLYYVVYGHQIIALIGTSLLNVACDVVICGLCVHSCSQVEILKHRLEELPMQVRPQIGDIVHFHNYLYGYVDTIQQKFRVIIGVQLVSSTLVVCFILYELSNTPLMTAKYLQFLLYMACMMTQIFFYCWYGNGLKLKSVQVVDTISEMDWTRLDNSTKKSLIMIMRRAMNPIELSSTYVFTMDLNTFVSILKMSYSTYNLLQRKKQM
ncbi:PREDICTED: odorant receptor 46a, isoform A-like [Dufourea novaeangliae]|uniref:odorant receptor 46a, isoform A-like n=1 Tax=Dufourea novaeangliae TaxID=178035 RepID=UPI000767305F|nr:PREDICTED: odorant receptor 46a, isoform A-like [Dufourea novaeangliae]